MNPHQIETLWTETENRILAFLYQFKWTVLFFLIIYLFSSWGVHWIWSHNVYPQWSRFFLIQDRFWSIIILIGGSFILLIRNTSWISIPVVILSYIIPLALLRDLNWAASIPILLILLNSSILRIGAIGSYLKMFLIFLSYILLYGLLAEDLIQTQDSNLFKYLAVIHFEGTFLYFIQVIWLTLVYPYRFHFNPLTFVYPLPLPAETQYSEQKNEFRKTWIKGAYLIFFGQLVLFIIGESIYLFPTLYEIAFLKYLSFIGIITGLMNTLSGLLHIFGFKTSHAVHFLILAKSPIETWQRGSIFMAKFIFNLIYLPSWKKFRNFIVPSIISILFIIFHLFILHDDLINRTLSLAFPELRIDPWSLSNYLPMLFWFLTWLLWIIMHHLIFQIGLGSLRDRNIVQWGAILATQIGNSMVLPISTFLLVSSQN